MWEIFVFSLGVGIGVIFDKQIMRIKNKAAAAAKAAHNEFSQD
jgi:hypothetical protein